MYIVHVENIHVYYIVHACAVVPYLLLFIVHVHLTVTLSLYCMYTHCTLSCRYEIMGGATQRLVVGMFSVAPATGVVTAGQSQTITVDCIAEKPGRHDEVHVHVHYTYRM